MNIRVLLSALLICCTMLSCDKSISLGDTSMSKKVDELRLNDLTYGTGNAHKMDVSLPQGRSGKNPVVILLHGSYWTTGDKQSMSRWQDSFTRSNIGVININTRNADTSGVHYQEIVEDIRAAINYVSAHSAEWNIRNSGYVLMGMNSGGHLALLYTHKYNYDGKIKAVIGLAAASDLTDDRYISNMIAGSKEKELVAITGKEFATGSGLPVQYMEASARFYPKKTPTLLIHGKADDIVPFSQANAFHLLLDNQQCYSRLLPVAGAGHDLNLSNQASAAAIHQEMQRWCWDFGM